jgi:hypothetical protein
VHLIFSAELSRHRVQAESNSLAEKVSKAVLAHLGDRHEGGRGHRGGFISDVERFWVRGHLDMERLGLLNYLNSRGRARFNRR